MDVYCVDHVLAVCSAGCTTNGWRHRFAAFDYLCKWEPCSVYCVDRNIRKLLKMPMKKFS